MPGSRVGAVIEGTSEECPVQVVCRFRPLTQLDVTENGGEVDNAVHDNNNNNSNNNININRPDNVCVETRDLLEIQGIDRADSEDDEYSSLITVAEQFGEDSDTVAFRITIMGSCEVSVEYGQSNVYSFELDEVFAPAASQELIYEECTAAAVNDALSGYRSTVLAYGQTGSGKTHTMFGPPVLRFAELAQEEWGLIPRACSDLLRQCGSAVEGPECSVEVSYLELYQENLRDLLVPSLLSSPPPPLEIRESPSMGVFVTNVMTKDIRSMRDVGQILADGERRRAVGAHLLNKTSSRSHAIFSISVRRSTGGGVVTEGRLQMVDLAGSEKVSKTHVEGDMFAEACKINSSLSALGKCIHALTNGHTHIPYRDSKLTRLLQDSFGGRSKATLVVCCSPCQTHAEETLSTLRFATRAKLIRNRVSTHVQLSSGAVSEMVSQLNDSLAATVLYAHNLEKTIEWMRESSLVPQLPPSPFETSRPAGFDVDAAKRRFDRPSRHSRSNP